MSKFYDDDQLNDDLLLDDILAEFGESAEPIADDNQPELPWPEAKRKPVPENLLEFPERSPQDDVELESEPAENTEEQQVCEVETSTADGSVLEVEIPWEDRQAEKKKARFFTFGKRPKERPVSVGTVQSPAEMAEPVGDVEPSDVSTPVEQTQLSELGQETVDQPEHVFPVYELPVQSAEILEFPDDNATSPLGAIIEKVRQKSDEFSQQMFVEEDIPEAVKVAEKLIPGVDVEQVKKKSTRERKPRKEVPAPKDIPPEKLAVHYKRGQGLLRLRGNLVLILVAVQVWMSFVPLMSLPTLPQLSDHGQIQGYVLCVLLVTACLLAMDIMIQGIWQLLTLKPSRASLTALLCVFTLADGLTQNHFMAQRGTLPYTGVATLVLFFTMRGQYVDRQGKATACRLANAVANPFEVTVEKGAWSGKDTYTKRSGTLRGFGSQIQEPDVSERTYKVLVPVVLVACVVCSLMASVGKGEVTHFLWAMTVMLGASSALASTLVFVSPFRGLTRRLAESGAAIPGWSGCAEKGTTIVITDGDLFPFGMAALNGIKVFGNYSVENVSVTCASVIRASGSGLEKAFDDLLRNQGSFRVECSDLVRHEAGGCSAQIKNQRVLVGSASFMTLMNVEMPQGLNVQHAVFCAIDGQLAGIFALNYVMRPSISQGMIDLVGGRITPILATRDFNLIPAMLRRKFDLPVERMDFPAVDRRVELSEDGASRNHRVAAVLYREGLAPYADAVIGIKRLRSAVYINLVVTLISSLIGLLLGFYLTYMGAWDAIAPAQLVIFLLAWYVPVWVISGWTNQF